MAKRANPTSRIRAGRRSNGSRRSRPGRHALNNPSNRTSSRSNSRHLSSNLNPARDNWYDADDLYIDYDNYDGGYYLYNRTDPQVRLAVMPLA